MENIINSNAQRPYNTDSMLPWQVTKEDFKGSRDVNILTHLFTGGTIYLTGEINQQKAIEFSMAMSVLSEERKKVKIIVKAKSG